MNPSESKTFASKQPRYAVCIRNENVAESLEIRKIYTLLPDPDAAESGMVRVVDESEEDYLYPTDWFAPLDLSLELISALKLAS